VEGAEVWERMRARDVLKDSKNRSEARVPAE